jgi:AraC family transcriptional activator of pobA
MAFISNQISYKVSPFPVNEDTGIFRPEDEFFEIIWIKNGTGSLLIDLEPHEYSGSVMFILAPGQIRGLNSKDISDGYSLRFKASVFETQNDFQNHILDTCIFDNEKSCPLISIPETAEPVIDELFKQIIAEQNLSEEDSETIVGACLKILVTHINRLKRKKVNATITTNTPQYKLFRQYRLAVERNYRQQHDVEFYAGLLNTQPRTLTGTSRLFAGKTAGELIRDRILLEAKRGLYNEALTIKELCFSLGFEDPAYFSRFFKKYTGQTPQEYKQHRRQAS